MQVLKTVRAFLVPAVGDVTSILTCPYRLFDKSNSVSPLTDIHSFSRTNQTLSELIFDRKERKRPHKDVVPSFFLKTQIFSFHEALLFWLRPSQ